MKDILDFDEAGCPRVFPAAPFVALIRQHHGDPCKAGQCPDWGHGMCPAYRAVNKLTQIDVTVVTSTQVKSTGRRGAGHREGYIAPGKKQFRW